MSAASTTWVAFFRNLNLGQARSHSPTAPQLLAAFGAAGAAGARSFQTNGTVVFDPGRRSATLLARDVVTRLGPVCGYGDAVVARSVDWLVGLDLADVGAQAEVSLYDLPAGTAPPVAPHRPDRGRITVLRADRVHAVSVNDQPRTGYATPTLERLLGVPVTSRAVSTVERLRARLRP